MTDARDPLYASAVALVTEKGGVTISFLQRKLRIGYVQAEAIVASMEADGLVTAVQKDGRRQVNMLALQSYNRTLTSVEHFSNGFEKSVSDSAKITSNTMKILVTDGAGIVARKKLSMDNSKL